MCGCKMQYFGKVPSAYLLAEDTENRICAINAGMGMLPTLLLPAAMESTQTLFLPHSENWIAFIFYVLLLVQLSVLCTSSFLF